MKKEEVVEMSSRIGISYKIYEREKGRIHFIGGIGDGEHLSPVIVCILMKVD